MQVQLVQFIGAAIEVTGVINMQWTVTQKCQKYLIEYTEYFITDHAAFEDKKKNVFRVLFSVRGFKKKTDYQVLQTVCETAQKDSLKVWFPQPKWFFFCLNCASHCTDFLKLHIFVINFYVSRCTQNVNLRMLMITDSCNCELDKADVVCAFRFNSTFSRFSLHMQVWRNYKRKSTNGWSIVAVVFEFISTLLIFVQLILTSANTGKFYFSFCQKKKIRKAGTWVRFCWSVTSGCCRTDPPPGLARPSMFRVSPNFAPPFSNI